MESVNKYTLAPRNRLVVHGPTRGGKGARVFQLYASAWTQRSFYHSKS